MREAKESFFFCQEIDLLQPFLDGAKCQSKA